jgi:hypothetical protein
MKKPLMLSALLILCQAVLVKAQNRQPVKLGLEISLNPGITVKDTRFAAGADLQLSYPVSDQFALTFSGGFTHTTGEKVDVSFEQYPAGYNFRSGVANIIPLKAGLKYYIRPQWYAAAGAGLAVDINGNSSAVWAGELGSNLSRRFSLGIRYEAYADFNSINQVALRAAYRLF